MRSAVEDEAYVKQVSCLRITDLLELIKSLKNAGFWDKNLHFIKEIMQDAENIIKIP